MESPQDRSDAGVATCLAAIEQKIRHTDTSALSESFADLFGRVAVQVIVGVVRKGGVCEFRTTRSLTRQVHKQQFDPWLR
jgi:hypothetical protein